MRFSKNKILNIFLLAVMLIAFGGGELFHHHGSSFEDGSDTRISSHEDCQHEHRALEKECSTCTFAHSFKNISNNSGFFDTVLIPVHYRTYAYNFTALINPFLHNNTGLSPPAVS